MISATSNPQEILPALRTHVETQFHGSHSRVPKEAAMLVRENDSGGYEVRITQPVRDIIERDFVNTYIEACDPPRGWYVWSLQVGGDHWPAQLDIEPAAW